LITPLFYRSANAELIKLTTSKGESELAEEIVMKVTIANGFETSFVRFDKAEVAR
jgi:hypothetical protein